MTVEHVCDGLSEPGLVFHGLATRQECGGSRRLSEDASGVLAELRVSGLVLPQNAQAPRRAMC